MSVKPYILGICLCFFYLSVPATGVWAQLDLQYQQRGDRYEGVKPKPVSGYDIELISVLTDYEEPLTGENFPKRLTLRFYLEKEDDAHLTVRELDYRAYYWLDKVQPGQPWKSGFQNVFTWPTDPVLNQLVPKLAVSEIGALVRIGHATGSTIEEVAPAVLYHTNPPETVEGYRFTMKTGEDARLLATVIQQATGQPIGTPQKFRRKRAGRPFTIHWDAKTAPEGSYILRVTGFSLSTNQSINKEVHFYHQPTLTP
ncbi:MAG: hypothetical protein OEZ57_06290 [Nitrospirota bacterium]|nr:hypothetical protein [Nitrospirota bacterium]MDH5588235.1 hypothetical protein [Nitrospirota bacterium]MDH5774507.1 hypothetical protein [Nitrospirota bacterium]